MLKSGFQRMEYTASLTLDGVSRGEGCLKVDQVCIVWSSGSEEVLFNYTDMALHAYSLGNESEPRAHLLIQMLASDEEEAGSEVIISLSSKEEVERAFQAMNRHASEISEPSEWITSDNLVST